MKQRLRDYIFVDDAMLGRYAEQVRDLFAKSETTSIEASVSLAGPSLTATKNTERRPLLTHEKILVFESYLRAANEAYIERPVKTHSISEDHLPRFVIETMTATKVILPVVDSPALAGLTRATLWVSDPAPSVVRRK